MHKQVLLVVGSPKGLKSTSAVLGHYLAGKLPGDVFNTEPLYIYHDLKKEESGQQFLAKFDNADIIILTFPLYADSPPSAVIQAMELMTGRRSSMTAPKRQSLMVIINCGFPESSQNDTALSICRKFALEAGIEWTGGLSLGGGGAIDGRPLDEIGGMARNVKRALDIAAFDIAGGRPVSEEASDLMAKPMMPVWLYLLGGNWGWRFQARKNRAGGKLNDRPYE